MAKRTDLKKILIIGSGPIVIGQAAEFDYAGTQACLALKEEGYEVVLVNSNPATIMTDTTIADKVYMEPLTLEYIAKILRYERPDAILPGIGGQTGLNLAMQLEQKGILKECRVELLGTSSESIERAEDRELFKELCQSIGEPVIPSEITYNLEEAKAAAERIGYPVVLRPAFTLGGTGGGFAYNEAELIEIGTNAFRLSPVHQVLIEKSVKGYKEIEFEVMRDSNDHAITICGMENIDPVGVHTGDSLVVAPIMTLSDHDMKMLNDSAIKLIKELKIEGGCNVQFALNPHSSEYYLIEVNPRVSRSSALASKASGYPIARVTAKIAVGMSLEEIKIANTNAAFEPRLDYVIAKLPRFPFDKFTTASNQLGTQMKATGEVMGIGSNLEECLLKGMRSLEVGVNHVYHPKFDNMSNEEILEYISTFRDDNIFAIAELLARGITVEKVHEITQITPYFLEAIKNIVDMEETLKAHPFELETLTAAKKMGFSDKYVARMWKCTEIDVFNFRKEKNLFPVFRMVDIERAQKKVEENNFGIRKRLLEYDDVMNKQRTVIYTKRRHALMGERIGMDIVNMIWDRCAYAVELGDYENVKMEMFQTLAMEIPFTEEEFNATKQEDLIEKAFEAAMANFKRKTERIAMIANPVIKQVYEAQGHMYENIMIPITDGKRMYNIPVNLKAAYETEGKEIVKSFEKAILLHTIDEGWKENLRELDELKHSVQNASYEQKDPLLIFKLESVKLFDNMVNKINNQTISVLMRGQIPVPDPEQVQVRQAAPEMPAPRQQYQETKQDLSDPNQQAAANRDTREKQRPEPIRVQKTPGRNDPCPCGSGKKFKNCHGRGM